MNPERVPKVPVDGPFDLIAGRGHQTYAQSGCDTLLESSQAFFWLETCTVSGNEVLDRTNTVERQRFAQHLQHGLTADEVEQCIGIGLVTDQGKLLLYPQEMRLVRNICLHDVTALFPEPAIEYARAVDVLMMISSQGQRSGKVSSEGTLPAGDHRAIGKPDGMSAALAPTCFSGCWPPSNTSLGWPNRTGGPIRFSRSSGRPRLPALCLRTRVLWCQ
jgi:hypothetical protein